MRKSLYSFTRITSVFLTLAVVSCKDDYSEEDALQAQQQIDLAVYVTDYSAADFKPVSNASVSISQGTATLEGTTDDKGVVHFPRIKVGSYVYTAAADNFTASHGTFTAAPENFREGQVTQEVRLFSMGDENAAIIRGTAIAETDVTNNAAEVAANLKVFADVSLGTTTLTFSTTTDASGNYELKVPTRGGATPTPITMRFADFEADQVIAFNKYADEPGDFMTLPQVLPRKESIKTVFSTSSAFQLNVNYGASGTIRSVYAIAEEPPAGGRKAIISNVYTNDRGEVIDLQVWDGGNYTNDADKAVDVTIVSLDGGSGASVRISLTGNITTSNVLTAYDSNNPTITPGAGYPKGMDLGGNFILNRQAYRLPSARVSLTVYPASINIANVDFGTGISRPKGLQ